MKATRILISPAVTKRAFDVILGSLVYTMGHIPFLLDRNGNLTQDLSMRLHLGLCSWGGCLPLLTAESQLPGNGLWRNLQAFTEPLRSKQKRCWPPPSRAQSQAVPTVWLQSGSANKIIPSRRKKQLGMSEMEIFLNGQTSSFLARDSFVSFRGVKRTP